MVHPGGTEGGGQQGVQSRRHGRAVGVGEESEGGEIVRCVEHGQSFQYRIQFLPRLRLGLGIFTDQVHPIKLARFELTPHVNLARLLPTSLSFSHGQSRPAL